MAQTSMMEDSFSQPFLIRPAVSEDIGRIIELSELFWAQTEFDIPFDAPSAVELAWRMIDAKLFVVLELDGAVQGICGGLKSPIIANKAYFAGAEVIWYIDEAYRNAGNGQALLEGIERAAFDAGVTYWTMMALEAVEPEKAERIYFSKGYKVMERSYTKRLR